MLRYQVDDMSCGHCVAAITAAVKGVDPTAQVAIDLSRKAVEVITSAADSDVSDAIREAGYTPAEATEAVPAAKASCCGGRR
ncbi:heavy-metal-associated domain-containing protein [Phenylobacterium sp.]|jgi:copper chaperone|uniref:heavy-metal-associated domain-containing protein n=1 Tax=Phenylobacterium sp. TaxID=1871053 RepID=UPI00272FA6AD|nr:heavy-metal-associated domain-containing protein [Phenylobacterium sp.]MDP1616594.1 heavy-metal-associated domain-containing protein [Phenylobacterium sp.]